MLDRAAWVGGTALLAGVAFVATWLLTTAPGDIPEAAEPPQPSPTVTPEVTFSPPALNGPPRLPGVWEWSELRGGECLETPPGQVTSRLTVVSCDTPHGARYLDPMLMSDTPDDSYPGHDAVAAWAANHCEGVTAVELGVGEEVDDLVVSAMYVADERSWQAGTRVVGCVVFRESGETLPDHPETGD